MQSLRSVVGQQCASSDRRDVSTTMLERSTAPLVLGKWRGVVGLTSPLMCDVEQQPYCSYDPTAACNNVG